MATQTLQQMRYVNNRDQAAPTFRGGLEEPAFKEAASQSYKAGAPVYLSSGLVTAVPTGVWANGQQVAGIPTADATGTTNTAVHLRVIKPGDRFVMNVYHSTAGSAVTAQSLLGTRVRLIVVNGNTHADIENTTIEDGSNVFPWVEVVGFWREDAVGDTYGRVVVEFGQYGVATDGSPQARFLQLAG